ncbi:MAG: adenylate kinase [Ignavibacteriales bacterium]|nr:adenylate kinase [Ignavibacteriales bacterium]
MILFFGAPGVGKGTQAKIVSSKLNLPHISTGDILREAITKKSWLGVKAKETMNRGELVPDDIMTHLIHDVLKDPKCKNGFILDGYPRSVHQAEVLQTIIDVISDDPLIVISLVADVDIIVDRLSQRRMCKACGNIVNLNFLKNSLKCPSCGSIDTFIKRKDDEEDVIKNRLEIFEKTTSPVLNYYKENDNVYEIDATLPVNDITKKILKIVT